MVAASYSWLPFLKPPLPPLSPYLPYVFHLKTPFTSLQNHHQPPANHRLNHLLHTFSLNPITSTAVISPPAPLNSSYPHPFLSLNPKILNPLSLQTLIIILLRPTLTVSLKLTIYSICFACRSSTLTLILQELYMLPFSNLERIPIWAMLSQQLISSWVLLLMLMRFLWECLLPMWCLTVL